MPGVKAVAVIQKPGTEIFWAGDEIVGVAAVDEGTAEDALRAIKVEYEVLPHFVSDAEPPKNVAADTGPISSDDFQDMEENQVPDDEVIARIQKRGISFKPDEKDYESMKGMGVEPPVIAALRKAKFVPAHAASRSRPTRRPALQTPGRSRQGLRLGGGSHRRPVRRALHRALLPGDARLRQRMDRRQGTGGPHLHAERLRHRRADGRAARAFPRATSTCCSRTSAADSAASFPPIAGTSTPRNLSKTAGGKPVKIMLDRRAEFEVAGMRPSAYARVKIAADKDGKLVAWDSRSWGTGGVGGGGTPPLPYIFEIPNQRKQNTAISTNQGSARAWRAPNHPQAAVITMCGD